MLFLIFTNQYPNAPVNVFQNLNAENFSKNGNDVLLIDDNLKTYLLNKDSDLKIFNPSDISTIFISDFDIRLSNLVFDVLDKIFQIHQEVCILFHNNGERRNQKELINPLISNSRYSQMYDSHVPGSLYYEQVVDLSTAVLKGKKEDYLDILSNISNKYKRNECERLMSQLRDLDIKNTIDNFSISSFIMEYVISKEEWNVLVEEIKTYKSPSELNQIINTYLKCKHGEESTYNMG